MSHITPRKEGRSGHLFKIEMMLLCNSIAPPGDDLSEGGREKLQTALLPFFATDDDKTDDGDAELLPFPFLQVTARAAAAAASVFSRV